MNASGEVSLAINATEEKERSKIMEQGKSNSLPTTHSESNNDVFHKAQKLYEQYYATNNENLFTQLIAITDTVYGKRTRNLLKQNGCYSDESEHTAMQEARIAIWERVRKCRENGQPDPDFIRCCKGIYYHKAMDAVRRQNTYRRRFSDEIGQAPLSLDASLPESGKSLGDTIEDTKSSPEISLSLEEQRWVFNSLFLLYCQTLVTTKAEPPRELALYYARILPHVLHINHEIETIPEEKMASAKWAYEHMKGLTMQTLGKKSECEMKKLIDQALKWQETFWQQLEQTVYINTEKKFLKDVIYTDVYGKGKIEDWSESMHKTIVKEAYKIAMNDPKLVESATEYISDRDKIYCLIKGGRDR